MSRNPDGGLLRSARYVVVDWDGTAVKNAWPDQTREFMPGFVDAMRRFHAAGLIPVIESSRFNPNDYLTQKETARSRAQAESERRYVRDTLDEAGLSFVQIHTQRGKPTGMAYIDDKGERYNGKTHSWRRMVDRVLARAELIDYVED